MSTDNQSRIGTKYRKLNRTAKMAVIAAKRQHGDLTQISFRTGYSVSHVCNVLHGRDQNSRILNFAYNMVRNRK